MSYTGKALEKLNEKQINYLQTLSAVILAYTDRRALLEVERNKGKMRGYLECLCSMGIISGSELKALYMYYAVEG